MFKSTLGSRCESSHGVLGLWASSSVLVFGALFGLAFALLLDPWPVAGYLTAAGAGGAAVVGRMRGEGRT